MSSVLLPWVTKTGWKMQSILLSGFRGPDNADLTAVKAVNRWLRRTSQNNADASKDYMREDQLPTREALCDELEFCTAHYVHHLESSLRVLSLYGPPPDAYRARVYCEHIAREIFHFELESDKQFERRHADKRPLQLSENAGDQM